jgi:hypothetical protein
MSSIDRVLIIDQSERELFDERFRAAVQVPTPLPAASDALVAYDSSGNVLGATYIHIRHLMGPYVLSEDAPPDTLTRLANTIADQLKATVRESLTATHADPPVSTDPDSNSPPDFGLSYDVYVAPGHAPPDGFERVNVEVWRRRVC